VVCSDLIKVGIPFNAGEIFMAFEKRDFWWMIGMAIACSSLDKRGWSEPGTALLAALVGAGLGFVISRLTKRAKAK
jgi:hypothetical protein